VFFIINVHAAPTLIAVIEILSSTYPTYSTLIAMEDLFLKVFIIQELAYLTVIPCEFDATVVARLLDL
jgi:hypothetical protein